MASPPLLEPSSCLTGESVQHRSFYRMSRLSPSNRSTPVMGTRHVPTPSRNTAPTSPTLQSSVVLTLPLSPHPLVPIKDSNEEALKNLFFAPNSKLLRTYCTTVAL